MRLPTVVLMAGLLTVIGCEGHNIRQSIPAPAASDDIVHPERVLVQFRDDTNLARIHEIVASAGGRIERSLGMPGGFLITPLSGKKSASLVTDLRRYKEIIYAEPDRVRPQPITPAQ